MHWTMIVGILILAYVLVAVWRGGLLRRDTTQNTAPITRSSKPAIFWLYIIALIIFGVLMIYNVFNF